jgi:hypothetical protein
VANAAIAPVAFSQVTWPGPKMDVKRTTVERARWARHASSPNRFE